MISFKANLRTTDWFIKSESKCILVTEPDLVAAEFNDLRYYIYFTVASIILFSNFSFSDIFPDSARYMLSALVQCEAAIIAVVVSLSLIAIQFAASSWSARVIDIFLKKYLEFWLLISLYIVAIAYGLYVISSIKDNNSIISYNVEFGISLSYRLGILAFLALIPYTWTTLILLKPSTIINQLSQNISMKAILSILPLGNPVKKDDPIQPIMDIIIASLMKSDEGTILEGLESLRSRITFLIKNYNFNDDDEIVFSDNIFPHLSEIGTLAASKRDEHATIRIIRTIHGIGYMATDQKLDFAANEAARILGDIGGNAAEKNLSEVVLEVVDALRDIGGKAAEHELLMTIGRSTMALEAIGLQYTKPAAFRAINALEKIGVEIASHKLESGFEHYRVMIVKSIKVLCLKSVEQGFYVGNAVRALEAIGLKTAEKRFKEATDSVVDALKIIETKADEVKNERTMIETAISLGNVLSACDSNEEAIQEYDKAIDIDSKNFGAWSGKGDTLMKICRYEDALNAYEKLFERGQSTTGWHKKESALRALGRNLEAEAALANLKEWKNKVERSGRFLDLTGNAQAAILRSQFDEAVKLYNEALEIRPKSAHVWYYKGEVLSKIGRSAEADLAFAKAKELGYTG